MYENYSKEIQDFLRKNKIEVGQRISVKKGNECYEGLLMPKGSGDSNCLVIKLDNGYNIGIEFKNLEIKKMKERKELAKPAIKRKMKFEPGKPTIAILHTGGTVASRIDYRTGGVFSSFTPEDLLEMYPELTDIANIRSRLLFQMHSEDIEFDHWAIIAREVAKEIEEGCDGVIITHGTDTMHYSSSALAFMLQDLPIPILLVGAQRSSDRGSSDAAMNLICAVNFIANSDFSGVAICMHSSMDDDSCFILPATKTRKMHTSRRDTFRPINDLPIAKVEYNGKIDFIKKDYQKKDLKRKLRLDNKFDKSVVIVKTYPGFSYKELGFYKDFHGIVLELTGLGHAPTTPFDDITKDHSELLKTIEDMSKKCIIVATSQCHYGVVNMNVYSPGRDLIKAGVIPCAMTTETAFVKLGWVLGHTKNPIEVRKLMSTNYVGEMIERIDPKSFLI